MILKAGNDFLDDHVRPRIPPDPESTSEAKKLWRRASVGKKVVVPPIAVQKIVELRAAQAAEEMAEHNLDKKKLALMTMLMDADQAEFAAGCDEGGKPLFTWKEQANGWLDQKRLRDEKPAVVAAYMKRGSHRVLRITKHGHELADRRLEQHPQKEKET